MSMGGSVTGLELLIDTISDPVLYDENSSFGDISRLCCWLLIFVTAIFQSRSTYHLYKLMG
jgi:hypothetical protein